MKKTITIILSLVSIITLSTCLTGCTVNRVDTTIKLTNAITSVSTSEIDSSKDNVAILTGNDTTSISSRTSILTNTTTPSNDNVLSLSFDYNGGAPVYLDNGDIKTAYLNKDMPVDVCFISYTVTTENGNVTEHYLGNPLIQGQTKYTEIPGIESSFVNDRYEITFNHEKLTAQTYRGQKSIITILSLDLMLGSTYQDYIYNDGFVEKHGNHYVGLLDESYIDTEKRIVGGVSLRANEEGVFEYMNIPTSYEETSNMYSFTKYDSSTSMFSYDATHLEYYYDRFLLGYTEVQETLHDRILDEIYYGERDEYGFDYNVHPFRDRDIVLDSVHQGQITVFDGVNNTYQFEYKLYYGNNFFFDLVLEGDNVTGDGDPTDGKHDSFSVEIKDPSNAFVTYNGLEVINAHIFNADYNVHLEGGDFILCTGVSIAMYDNLTYGFDEFGEFKNPYQVKVNGDFYQISLSIRGREIRDFILSSIFTLDGEFYGYILNNPRVKYESLTEFLLNKNRF